MLLIVKRIPPIDVDINQISKDLSTLSAQSCRSYADYFSSSYLSLLVVS